MKRHPDSISRRQFFRQSACASLGISGLVNTLAHFQLVNRALAQTAPPEDFKALVVFYQFGGNDSNNMLLPRIGHPQYANYKNARGILGILDPNDSARLPADPASLPLTTTSGNYAVHPNMPEIRDIFNAGDLAFVANVGTLAYPITRAELVAGTKPIPPRLFSHSDQQLQWQSSIADQPFTNGWGGRVADLLHQPGSDAVSMSISIAGVNSLQVGNQVAQYTVSPLGAISLGGYGPNYSLARNPDGSLYNTSTSGKRLKAFEDIMRYTHDNLLEDGYDEIIRRARASEGSIGNAITEAAGSSVAFDTLFGSGTAGLIGQLKMVAKLIAGRNSLGNSRQIYFVSFGGYDTHSSQLTAHANLMTEVSTSLSAFRQAMLQLGVNDKVLLMTHSDFARTLKPNGTDITSAGSDHGWGGHHIVMGGAVNGGKIYGTFPSLVTGAEQDSASAQGRWIPGTSVDQYAAVAAKWLGVESSAMSAIFPNLSRFDDPFGGTANLAYV